MARLVPKSSAGSTICSSFRSRSCWRPVGLHSRINSARNSQTRIQMTGTDVLGSHCSQSGKMSQLLGLQEFRSSISTQAARSAFQTPNPISGVATLADVPQEYLKYPVPDDCKLLILPDGRHMAYAEYGSKAHDAHPFIFVHGLPDTRLDACLLSSDVTIAEKLNIRWIGIDRPGYGLSTFQSNRTVLGWVDDIQHLIRHLKLTKYHILSVSGGTPYALACAKLLPREGLLSVGIAMGVGPKEAGKEGLSMLNRLVEWIWEKHLWAFEKILDGYVVPKVHEESPERTEAFVRQSSKHMTKVDREAWEGEEMIQGLVKIFREVYRQGSSKGYVEDIKLVTGHWGYDLNDVGYEGVRLFYGKRDVNTPPALGRYMAARLPNSVLKEYDGKTHFTMWDHVEEMLLDMLGKTKTDEESH